MVLSAALHSQRPLTPFLLRAAAGAAYTLALLSLLTSAWPLLYGTQWQMLVPMIAIFAGSPSAAVLWIAFYRLYMDHTLLVNAGAVAGLLNMVLSITSLGGLVVGWIDPMQTIVGAGGAILGGLWLIQNCGSLGATRVLPVRLAQLGFLSGIVLVVQSVLLLIGLARTKARRSRRFLEWVFKPYSRHWLSSCSGCWSSC
jgi:hypothetical protein